MIEYLSSILAGLATLAAGALASTELIRDFVRNLLGQREHSRGTYTERLSELTRSLTKASTEVDAVLAELAQVAHIRQSAVEKLESDLISLESREKELKTKINALEKIPVPVAEHFAQLLKTGEKRNARRDYALFGAGVVVTTSIAILMQLIVG